MLRTKFMISGATVDVYRMNDDTVLDVLPAKIYTVRHDQMRGFYLEITKNKLEIPVKIYGKARDRVNKCINTYKDRSASTGILLTGDKGTGKTLLMSLLANEVIDRLKLPVLLIKDAYAGAEFTTFIESMGECCLVFDEFGKMYASSARHNSENEVSQKALLSLFDGVDKTKRLIVVSENSEIDINEFMINRPSRLYYHFRYRKLDEDSIAGYCTDYNVTDKTQREIIDLSRRTRIFSFDMLQSIVEEHLRFNSPIDEIVKELNIDTREDAGITVEIIKVVDKITDEHRELAMSRFISKPERYTYIQLKPSANVTRSTPSDPDVSEDDDEEIHISDSDLAYESNGNAVYETKQYTIVTKDVPTLRTNYLNMLS